MSTARLAAEACDTALSHAAEAFDYLLAVTPCNAAEQWAAFRARGFTGRPSFRYPPPPVDLAALRRDLATLPVEAVDDEVLRELFARKRAEILAWADLAASLETPAFLDTSLALYGGVDDDLLRAAEELLAALPVTERRAEPGGDIDGVAFARLCRDELDRYRRAYPALAATVRLDPSFPGVMVSAQEVIVEPGHRVAAARAEALVQHEVGTHVVTNVNGAGQPLRLLAAGLPGYEETQEGLAVFAEYAVGGLTLPRLAIIAARVVAARRLLDGVAFDEVFAELAGEAGLREDRAWELAMRTWRGGGLTKDVIYLRGLSRVLRHLAGGGPLEPLTLGKLDLADLDAVERLRDAGWVRPAALTPRWLAHPAAAPRLAAARAGTLLGLVPGLWRPAERR